MRIFLIASLVSVSVFAQSTWTGATNSDWGTTTNWSPNTVPNAIDATAVFSGTFINQPDLLGNSFTIGTIQFGATTPTVITGTGDLTFQVSTGNASIISTTAGNQIAVGMILSNNLFTTVSQNLTLTLSGFIFDSTPSSFTAGGAGTTFLEGTNSYRGGTFVNTGILQVNSDSALGAALTPVTINSATFQITTSFSTPRNFILGGTGTFNTNGQNLTLTGTVSGGSLTKTGTGTLTLTGTNTYSGGTNVNVGTLRISADQNLGANTSALTLANNTTLQAGASFNLGASRSLNIAGAVTIDTAAFSPTIASNIAGDGSLNIIGTQLTLTGSNTYTGSTTVNGATLIGNTTSLQGNISAINGATVIFNQAGSGTYAGVYQGNVGTTLQLQGGGTYTFTGNSSASLSNTNLVNANLILPGILGSSAFLIDASSTLSGNGTVFTTTGLTNSGKIMPGTSGTGTLSVNGNVTLIPNSGTLVSQIDPLTNGLLQVSGTANLSDGILSLVFDPNQFFPLTSTHTLLIAGSRTGMFGTILSSNSQFSPTLIYTPTTVELLLTNLQPFASVPFGNSNERAVGQNIDAISTASLLSADFVEIINSFAELPFSEINRALDQLHPAALSAFAELQTTLGGQILNRLHQRAGFTCGCYCSDSSFFWVEPFGNWLHVKKQGMQTGFQATTRGVAVGFDQQFFDCWTLGLAGIYQATDLTWSRHRGYSYLNGLYGALYSDINAGRFYLGSSFFLGKDSIETVRKIRFTFVNRQAKSKTHAYDAGGQLTTAYFFGSRSFHLFPYGTVDFLYLENDSFHESGANSLNLSVQEYRSSTLRAESGLGFQFTDRNYDETVCVTPLFSMGYVLELPLHRDRFKARFEGVPIAFRTKGWDEAWQLLNLRFGLTITYRCFSLDSQYIADLSTEGNPPYVNQRANFRLGWQF